MSTRPRLDRFVIEASVSTTPPGSQELGPIPLRVHVYDSIKEIWLTPSTLTVRRGTTGTRFYQAPSPRRLMSPPDTWQSAAASPVLVRSTYRTNRRSSASGHQATSGTPTSWLSA